MSDKAYVRQMFGTTFHLFYNIFHLIFSMPFLVLSLFGNLVVSLFALAFYQIEVGVNPKIFHLVDCFWWSFATATTVGYGDITPVTTPGKVLGILLMLVGTAMFATYTAFFAKAIMGEDYTIKPRGQTRRSS